MRRCGGARRISGKSGVVTFLNFFHRYYSVVIVIFRPNRPTIDDQIDFWPQIFELLHIERALSCRGICRREGERFVEAKAKIANEIVIRNSDSYR